MFDWPGFLRQHRVEYVTTGPNVARGHIAIHCPFCGNDDPSQHMSISLEGRGWHCWRNRAQHKGKSPVRLIQALLHCAREYAEELAGGARTIPDDFLDQIKNNLSSSSASGHDREIAMPKEFKLFEHGRPSARPYMEYLRRRGFDSPQMLASEWGLRYCTDGPYQGRVIFPVLYNNKLTTWTGRSISSRATIRYKTLSTKTPDKGYPQAVRPITDLLLWWDRLISRRYHDTIVLCEGPFDALKINYLGWARGVCATCFFTNTPSHRQIDLLHELLPCFKYRYLLLDQGTLSIAIRTVSQLVTLRVEPRQLPLSVKDPGMLNQQQFDTLFP